MERRENKNLEYKEKITKSYLKTVSAFSNYGDGEIIFGVTDDNRIVGIDNPKQACLDIENQINDSIKPNPRYMLSINDDNTITLFVYKGDFVPYTYNGKAYKRNDSSTIEVGVLETRRLNILGLNLSFEELESRKQNLSFKVLEAELKKQIIFDKLDQVILEILDLYDNKNGFNNAAALLADNNDFPGLDIVIYGENKDVFKKRFDLSHKSIISQYLEALDIFNDNYIVDVIKGGFREKIARIPYEAFREAIANALVHREWDVSSNIKVEFSSDEIVITSPGGLPDTLSEEEYLNEAHSELRNKIIADVFYRLRYIEKFATGIKRIKNAYSDTYFKPTFIINENSITIKLPVISEIKLSDNEKLILSCLSNKLLVSRQEIEEVTGLSRYTVIRGISSLIEKNAVIKIGESSKTKYLKIK